MKKNAITECDLIFLSKYGLYSQDLKGALLLEFEQGEFVVSEGYPINYLYFVLSGKAKTCLHSSSGKQLLLSHFISTGIIGDMELMTEEKEAMATVQAVSGFKCIGVPRSNNSHLLNNSLLTRAIAKELAYKLKRRDVYCANILMHTLEERLCAYITHTAVNGVFCEILTDVAELLGSSYRHLLRSLAKLCRDGILKRQNNGFKVQNERLLCEKAGDLYFL